MIIAISAIVTPQLEGYGDTVARTAILAISGHWLMHNVIALKYGQIDIKGFLINRESKPNTFAATIVLKSLCALVFIFLILK
ncbi:hypothetical protein G3R49_18980 [Shewanella sp. WXL01]|nr:hypothetical protein [Shewanella sp. WXL01]